MAIHGYMSATEHAERPADTVNSEKPIWSQQEVDDMVKDALDTARMAFERVGEHAGIFLLLGTYDPFKKEAVRLLTPIMQPPMRNVEDKNRLATILRVAAKGTQAVGILSVMEIWMAHEAPGADPRTRIPPAERPDRTEHLALLFESYRFGNFQYMADIARLPDGKPVLGEWKRRTIDRMSGRFAGILPTVS